MRYILIQKEKFKATFFDEIVNNIKELHLDNPFAFINERLDMVNTRFVPKVGTNTQYAFNFSFDSVGNTTSLLCNNVDISQTFTSTYLYEFSNRIQLPVSLMQYYGIEKSSIIVKGIPENIDVIKYIAEQTDWPF